MRKKTEKITRDSPYWKKINALALKTFPPKEYLKPNKLVDMAEEDNFDFWAQLDEDIFVGFMEVQTFKSLS